MKSRGGSFLTLLYTGFCHVRTTRGGSYWPAPRNCSKRPPKGAVLAILMVDSCKALKNLRNHVFNCLFVLLWRHQNAYVRRLFKCMCKIGSNFRLTRENQSMAHLFGMQKTLLKTWYLVGSAPGCRNSGGSCSDFSDFYLRCLCPRRSPILRPILKI